MDKEHIIASFDGLNAFWRDLLGSQLRAELCAAIAYINKSVKTVDEIVPEPRDIFNAFRLCAHPRVIIIGQDPYTQRKQACGLSFSVKPGVAIPASLRAIYESMVIQGVIDAAPTTGDLSGWAAQGVLLLNASLTTSAGKSNAHVDAWAPFTSKLITLLNESFPDVIYILFGNFAQKYANGPRALAWGHPSPLNTYNKTDNPKHFKYNKVFAQANEMLVALGQAPIDWSTGAIIAAPNIAAPPINANVINTNTNAVTRLLYLFTDGGSRNNGKPTCRASWAFVIMNTLATIHSAYGIVESKNDGLGYTSSNNRGELTGMLNGLKWLGENNDILNEYTGVVLVSDSEYSLKSISTWFYNWKKRGLLASRKNIDLIEQIVELKDKNKIPVTTQHIYSHKQAPADPAAKFLWNGNNIADELCQLAFK